MFKNWKISRKLSAGFGILVLILCTTAYLAWSNLTNVRSNTKDLVNSADLVESLLSARVQIRNFFLYSDKKYLTLVDAQTKKCDDIIAGMKGSSTLDAKDRETVAARPRTE